MLPRLPAITFEYTLPVSKKKIKYKPYTVREEKILLVAAQSGEEADLANAVKEVLNNCILNEDVDVAELHLFDVEVLLTLLRIVSTSNEVEIAFEDQEDKKIYKFSLDLQEILDKNVAEAEIPEKNILLKDPVGVVMNEITLDLVMSGDLEKLNDPSEVYTLLKNLIKYVYEDEEVYNVTDVSLEEFAEFLDSFDREASDKLSSYFINMPKMKWEIKYKNSKGTEREIRFEGIADFFH